MKPSALTVALALVASGCTTGTNVELDSLDGVELDYEVRGDTVVPRMAGGSPLQMAFKGPRAQVVFLDFDGPTIQYGDWREDNAQTNTSFIIKNGAAAIPAFDAGPWGGDRGAVIGGIVAGLQEDFAPYNVSFVTSRPGGAYTTMVVGGTAEHIGWSGPVGLAPLDAGNWNESDIGFVFSAELGRYGYDVRHIAWTISHELGHSLGLNHISPNDDIMNPVIQQHALRWGEGPSEDGGYQRDHDVLGGVLAGAPPPPPPPTGCGLMSGDMSLSIGQGLSSCNGRYTLQMQGDGNLVLYDGPTALWHTQTYGTTAQVAVMQSDGNFVLYSAESALWNSGTAGHQNAFLAVQDDGNLVVYSGYGRPIWVR